MNAAQTIFGFELVDMSVPLDVWDIDRARRHELPLGRARRAPAAGQAGGARASISWPASRATGCATTTGSTSTAGGPTSRKPPVVIFSFAGFDQLKPEGPETDRAIANAMVAGLAGFFGDVEHATQQRREGLSAGVQRRARLKHLVGRAEVRCRCRRKLKGPFGVKSQPSKRSWRSGSGGLHHSTRSAALGSSRVARQTGSAQPAKQTSAKTSGTTVSVRGSVGAVS